MLSKNVNKLIIALSVTLMITGLYTFRGYKNKQEDKAQLNIPLIANEVKTLDKEVLIDKLNKENKLQVLSGTANIKVKYSDEEILADDVNLRWLKQWFEEQCSRDLSVTATYKFVFTYNLQDLKIETIGDKAIIFLSKNRLNTSVELVENESFYTDRVGFLSNCFSPNEINSLNGRTKKLVNNTVQSSIELRDKALINLQENISELLDVQCEFNTTEYDVVENKDVSINNID